MQAAKCCLFFFIYTLARAFQVFYFEKMEVNDFRNDVLLAEACRSDVDAYCKHVEPGAPFLLYFLLRFRDGLQLWMSLREMACAHHAA